jgi:hypothetical protein
MHFLVVVATICGSEIWEEMSGATWKRFWREEEAEITSFQPHQAD